MVEEIAAITQVLNKNIGVGLDRYEIKKKLHDDFNLKIGPKQVQNYLQSFFRNHIIYDRDSYKYSIKEELLIELNIDSCLHHVSSENRMLLIGLIRTKHMITYDDLLDLMKRSYGLNFDSTIKDYLQNLELNDYSNDGDFFVRDSSDISSDYFPFHEVLLRFNNTVSWVKEENDTWDVSARMREDQNILRLFYLLETMERGMNPLEWKKRYYEFKRLINEVD